MTDVCTPPRPNIATLAESIKTELSARTMNGGSIVPLSTEDIAAYVFAGAAFEVASIGQIILRESDPDTMCCDNLLKWAGRRKIYLLSADRARGFLTLTGDPGTVIPPALFFTSNALQYDLDPAFDNPTVIGANGTAVVKVVANSPGLDYNLPVGTILTLGITVVALQGTAVAGSALAGGSVAEDCESLRARIAAIRKRGAVSTNEAWFIEQTFKYPGVTKVCIDKCNCCDSGWLVIYPFFGALFPPYGVPNSTILEDMTKWVFGTKIGAGEGWLRLA